MKTLLSILIPLLGITVAFSQGVAINETGAAPHSSAILDVSSTKKGFLPPVMTTSQRDSINNPADGLVIFNLTVGCLNHFFAGSWYEMCGEVTYPSGTLHCAGIPTAVVDVLNPATGKTWMDRNLGAKRAATRSTDSMAYGDLYQWGRRADGHQCRNADTTKTISSIDQPTHGKFILAPSSPFDWRIPHNDNLWQGVNGVNNPCPNGYRLPTAVELNDERLSWNSNTLEGAFASPLKMPVMGYRSYSNGVLYNVGEIGLYWASTIHQTDSRTLSYSNLGSFVSSANRAEGMAVRCIKDNAFRPGFINSLDCNSSTPTGTLTEGEYAINVSDSVPYTGGNGGNHEGQTVASNGVTGLYATLEAGTFANYVGTLVYTITGIPSGSGTASFDLNIGGQTCRLTRMVNAAGPTYPAGTVHCTATPTEVIEVINPATGRTWMDRNLGASRVATSSTDAEGYGDLYQWGRRADGHQCRNSDTTSVGSFTNQPAHGKFILPVPPIFPFNDWRSASGILWQGLNGENNPCPDGFRIPTSAELDAERATWSSQNGAGAYASPLKFSLAGGRFHNTGTISSGGNGEYWSSTEQNSTESLALMFSAGSAIVHPAFSRAKGRSVRCIKEMEF